MLSYVLSVIGLSVVMQNVVILSSFMLSDVALCVLSVVMLCSVYADYCNPE